MSDKALDLSRNFFCELALPALKREFPAWVDRIAAGLAGNGSECFGYDDEYSRDHDWGADFYLWLTSEDLKAIGENLSEWMAALLKMQNKYPVRQRSIYGAHVGVLAIDDFYTKLIGFPQGPETLREWRIVPEENLALAVNGSIFYDPLGAFSAIRQKLKEGYPPDLRLKKIAADCMAIAQTGQYNLKRCRLRKDSLTAHIVISRFLAAAASLTIHLNRRYTPYYKWLFRFMSDLPRLGPELMPLFRTISVANDADLQQVYMDKVCDLIQNELVKQNLSDNSDTFFVYHAERIQTLIQDDFLRKLPPQYI